MMNQIALRMWRTGLAMLSPTWQIDRFLDWLEQVCVPMIPAPAERLACQSRPIERRLDRLDA